MKKHTKDNNWEMSQNTMESTKGGCYYGPRDICPVHGKELCRCKVKGCRGGH